MEIARPISTPASMVPTKAAIHTMKSRKFALYRKTASLNSNKPKHADTMIAPIALYGINLKIGVKNRSTNMTRMPAQWEPAILKSMNCGFLERESTVLGVT